MDKSRLFRVYRKRFSPHSSIRLFLAPAGYLHLGTSPISLLGFLNTQNVQRFFFPPVTLDIFIRVLGALKSCHLSRFI